MMRGYCDTDTLFHNTKRHADQSEVKTELDALTVLLAKHGAGEITLFRSRVNLREVEATKDADQLSHLLADYEALEPVPLDERHYGNSDVVVDRYGSVVSSPLVSDVQDEKILADLQALGLKRRDAEHITQTLCNHCEVFLTRDYDSIIKIRNRIESQFPEVKILRPSELENQLHSP
jgi:hypothetical protein